MKHYGYGIVDKDASLSVKLATNDKEQADQWERILNEGEPERGYRAIELLYKDGE